MTNIKNYLNQHILNLKHFETFTDVQLVELKNLCFLLEKAQEALTNKVNLAIINTEELENPLT